MATNYKKNSMNRRNGNKIGALMFAFVSFIFGYLISTVFTLNQLSGWINTNVLSQKKTEPKAQLANQQAPLPKPKFEFYTLLAKENIVRPAAEISASKNNLASTTKASAASSNQDILRKSTSDHLAPIDLTITQKLPLHEPLAVADKTAKQMSAVLNNSEHFIVQVASFKNRYEAEKMKAALVLRGFDVYISSINQQGTWHRVVIGPFLSRTQAQKAQLAFARSQHIMGMIRKMDV